MASVSEPRNLGGPQGGGADEDDDELSDRPTISKAEELRSPHDSGISRSVPPDIQLRVEDLDWLLGAPSVAQAGAAPAAPTPGQAPTGEFRSPSAPPESGEYPDSRRSPGEIIAGRYRLLGLAAQGGMGTVYVGEHLLLRSPVAIKLLGPEAKDRPELIERFRREALVGAHVRHPNIAAATDFGRQSDGYYYLVLEFVDGTTLESELGSGPFAPGRAARVGLQIADGLRALHDQGVIHRDLKPSNVMLVKRSPSPKLRDTVKLIDFGLAKLDRSLLGDSEATEVPEERITSAGMLFGTLAYLAPEAALGMEAVDVRSDLYALGMVLYRMLAGRHPFTWQGEGELLRKHMQEVPPRFADCVPHLTIPPGLEAIVQKLLAKEPRERYQSAEEVEQDLAPFAEPDSAVSLLPGQVMAQHSTPASLASAPTAEADVPVDVVATTDQPRPFWLRPWPWFTASAVLAVVAAMVWPKSREPVAPVARTPTRGAGVLSPGLPVPPPRPAASGRAPDTSSTSSSPTVAQRALATEAEREQIEARWLRAIGTGRWETAADVFVEVVERDSEYLASKRGQNAAASLLDALYQSGPAAAADQTLRRLAQDAGPAGFDVLWHIALHRGGSPSFARVTAALSDPSLFGNATPEIKAALDLYRAGCGASSELLEQVASVGDMRAILLFLAQRDRCPKSEFRDRAFYRLQKRVNAQRR